MLSEVYTNTQNNQVESNKNRGKRQMSTKPFENTVLASQQPTQQQQVSSQLVVTNDTTDLFHQVMQKVADNLNLNVDFQHEGWKVTFTNKDTQNLQPITLMGYDLGLNNSLSFTIARDKFLCSQTLQEHGIPAVEHTLLSKTSHYTNNDIEQVLTAYRQDMTYPVVIKQNDGGGGKNIYFAFDETQFIINLADLMKKNVQVALSPYYDFNIEYRCTVLDDQVLMSYGKTKGDNLQNNLSKGAQVVDVPPTLKEEIHALAIQANKALGLRFSNVDIIETKQGLKVLEINGTVALKRVLASSQERFDQAVYAYTEALKLTRGEKYGISETKQEQA